MLIPLTLLLARPAFESDWIVSSFAFFGCNRVDKEDWNPKENPSSANLPQLRRTFSDLSALQRIPRYVFGGGDLVLGYADDRGETTHAQLVAWKSEYDRSPLAGKTTFLPVAGNHELNKKTKKGKLPNAPTVDMWNRWLRESGFPQPSANGPKPKDADKDRVAGDQSRLNYSFDDHGVRYVVLNTDTLTSEPDPKTGTKVAWIPANWAKSDIERAQHRKSTIAIFLIGHRNLVDPTNCTGDSPIDKQPGEILLKALRDNDKVKAYVCAHVHASDIRNLGGKSGAYQIIAGNGGSSLEPDWKPSNGTFFGYVRLETYRSGRVLLTNFRRPTPKEPQRYLEAEPVAPPKAQPISTVLFEGSVRRMPIAHSNR